jgi:hypothetical protein
MWEVYVICSFWFSLIDFSLYSAFFVGCEVRGILDTVHLIPVVLAITLCHAMFGVNVCVGISAVGEK